MIVIPTLKFIAALASVLFGIIALIQPQRTAEAASLTADTPAGIAEIRASWGGLFIGLGVAVLFLRSYDAYLVFASAYMLTALVRMMTWAIDNSIITRTAIIILCFEIISVIIFVLPEGLL